MSDAELTAMPFAASARAVAATADDTVMRMPAQPKTVRDTGLDQALIVELVAKSMYAVGRMHLPVLTSRLHLSINVMREVLGFMLAEQLVEVSSRGDSDLDVYYQLTHGGKLRAVEFLGRCRYAGPAPVTLAAYRETVLRQSSRDQPGTRVGAAEMANAFADDTMDRSVRDVIGAALQSSRSLMLYGPSGSGKTTLARKLGRLQQALVAVPFAVLVDQAIIQLYDPAVHVAPPQPHARHGDDRRSTDSRWALCQRPVVHVGAELSPDMLDLRFDQAGGTYYAPPHLLANNGMLIVDDLGRQRVTPANLLNRWSSPIDSGVDQLSIEGGQKISVPFDVTMLFATNIAPHLLLDESSMRRVGYKIHIGALHETGYRALCRRACRQADMAYDDQAIEHLITHLHAASGVPLLASYPAELLSRIADFASFAGTAPRLTIPALEQAWISMFAGVGAMPAAAPAHAPVPHFAHRGDPLMEKIS